MGETRDTGPRFLVWWIAAISLVLPIIGAALALVGASQLYRGGAHGWLLYAGLACFALDLAIDLWWSHPCVSVSDLPDLNARGAQLVGRTALVEEEIRDGRGKVRIGDTLWPVEGPEAPAGARVRITGMRGTLLSVVPTP